MDSGVGTTDGNVSATEVDDKSEVDSEVIESAKAIADDEILKNNTAFVKVYVSNVAMVPSTLISDTQPDDIKQSRGKDVSNEQHKQVIITENKYGIVDNANIDSDVSVKTPLEVNEETNSTIGVFEDACDYVDDDQESDHHNVSDQEHISAAESWGECEEGKETIQVPSVPVPVDYNTYDPLYIPSQGGFYEHDDRMAYSTSGEGSNSDDGEGSDHCRIRRQQTSSKRSESSKKVLAASKVAAPIKASLKTSASGLETSQPGSRKYRDINSLEKWTHDMYDEREQTRKSRDELLVSYGYDIREESEAPKARLYRKYGRADTTKHTLNWQDTKTYTGASGAQHSSKVKNGGLGQRSIEGLNKNKNKSATSDEYTSEFPALKNVKPLKSSTSTENPVVAEALGQKHDQYLKSPSAHDEKKTVSPSTGTGPSRNHTPLSWSSTKYETSSGNRHYQQDHQNGPTPYSSLNKNFFTRSSLDSPIVREKIGQFNQENYSGAVNYFNRKQQPQKGSYIPHLNYKQNLNNTQGSKGNHQRHQNSSSAAPRGRNFHQHHNNSLQQYNNCDRYFAKRSLPISSNLNQQHYDHSYYNHGGPTTAGTGRTQHSGNYHNLSSQYYENEPIEQPLVPPPPVVRSSKRYSVQRRRELPNYVLNFGDMSKAPQSQQPAPATQHQQQNGLVMQDQPQTALQQMQASLQQLQQQQPIQIHQLPPPIQMQQYYQPLQQLHHGMVLDHNAGLIVMATDPFMYHQIYATPQYTIMPGSATGGTDDQSAAITAAASLQMFAAQAAVYQPVESETFMTTYYEPQQQPPRQPCQPSYTYSGTPF